MTCAELLGRLAGGGHRGADAGVVDQDVDAAELGHGRVDQRLALRRFGDVGGDRQRAPAGVFDQTRCVLELLDAPGASATSAPASANAWANDTPSPDDAPVTMTTLSSSRNLSSTDIRSD